jgi:tetratricopeptide (TPR) repeat protein
VLLSLLVSWGSTRLAAGRSLSRRITELGHVDNPHNQGKLGSLYLAHRRPARAVEPLRRAAAGEPDSPEWHYRLGCAELAIGHAAEAAAALERAAAIDGEYAYGEVQLRLAQARTSLGEGERALAALDRFDSDHGPSPESALLRGVAQKRMGRRDEARASFRKVSVLSARAAQFQRARNRRFVLRALVSQLL